MPVLREGVLGLHWRQLPRAVSLKCFGLKGIQRLAVSALSRCLLPKTATLPINLVANHDHDRKLLSVVGARAADRGVNWRHAEVALAPFLEQALGILVTFTLKYLFHRSVEVGINQCAYCVQALVEVQRADHGLKGITKVGDTRATSAFLLPSA